MKERHIILRSIGGSGAAGLHAPSVEAAGAAPAPVALAVDVEEVERRELARIARNRDVVAIARAMPMKLVEPVERAAAPMASGGAAWGISAVRADTSPFTGDGMVVAVLDTGIARDHEAFRGVTLVEKDFTGCGNGDSEGHGTHCAGTIFGRDVNNQRIGVARGVRKALIGKVLGSQGSGSDVIVSAINWAVDEGANVISMSLGMDYPGFVELLKEEYGLPLPVAASRALEGYRQNVLLFERVAAMVRQLAAFRQSCLIIAAAGNESMRDEDPDFEVGVSPPAVSEGNISVGALGAGNGGGLRIADFSNTGAMLSAPGVSILSAGQPPDGFALMSGTSMATPHAVGVAALWGEKLQRMGMLNTPNWSGQLLASCVTAGLATPFDPTDVGAGLVQAPQN